jgi:hypothetical protein
MFYLSYAQRVTVALVASNHPQILFSR